MLNRFFASVLFLLCSCSTQSNWELSSIPSAQKEYDSGRLCYLPSDRLSGMSMEFFYSNGTITGYLCSESRRFASDETTAQIRIGSENIEIPLQIHEGRMRARLPHEMTIKAASALQDGQSVAIIVGSLQQNFEPDRFSGLFQQLTKGSNAFLNSIEGPLP